MAKYCKLLVLNDTYSLYFGVCLECFNIIMFTIINDNTGSKDVYLRYSIEL